MYGRLSDTSDTKGGLADEIQEFQMYKRSLISQGRSFCTGTAPQCREKIAALATDFLSDDVTVRLQLLAIGVYTADTGGRS